MSSIRLILVDDHEVVRTGLKSFLDSQEGIEVVGVAGNGNEAVERALQVRPDVVVMDISMPSMDGLEATRNLKALIPSVQVLALTVHEDKQYLFQMMAAGASGYLTKQSAATELVEAVRTVAKGNVYLQPVLARWLLDDYRRLVAQPPAETSWVGRSVEDEKDLSVLSKREKQVLEMVAEGYTNALIGERLEISHKTVARHRERIMNKLQMHSSTELVKFAIRTGLIDVQ